MYWRPGCMFCTWLLRSLDAAGVDADRRNIWEDVEAAEFVRMVNRGDETVPTVVVGTDVYTNPSPADLLERLGRDDPGLMAKLRGRPDS